MDKRKDEVDNSKKNGANRGDVKEESLDGDDGFAGNEPTPIPEDDMNIVHSPEVPEVALTLWLMLTGGGRYKVKSLSIAALENGLRNPSLSDTLSVVHSTLLQSDTEVIDPQKDYRVSIVRRPFEWWATELATTVRTWIQNRRSLAYDLKSMESNEYTKEVDEENIEWHKTNIEELDLLLKPILSGKIPDIEDVVMEDEDDESAGEEGNEGGFPESTEGNKSDDEGEMKISLRELRRAKEIERRERRKLKAKARKEKHAKLVQEQEDKEEAIIASIVPFNCPDGYLSLTPHMRLMLLHSLVMWRANGNPEPSLQEALRVYDDSEMRYHPFAEDQYGRRYWFFPQFFQDCRIYRETLESFEELPKSEKAKPDDENSSKSIKKEEISEENEESDREDESPSPSKCTKSKKSGKVVSVKKYPKRKGKGNGQLSEEELLRKQLEMEFGRRLGSRKRQQVQRFEKEQAEEFRRREEDNQKKRRMQQLVSSSDDEDLPVRKKYSTRHCSGKKDSKSEKKTVFREKTEKKVSSKREKKVDNGIRRPTVRGPERVKEWRLVANSPESLQKLIDTVSGFHQNKRQRNPNGPLLKELREKYELMEIEADNIRKAAVRAQKLQKLYAMPRKRSSRVQVLEERRQKEEEEAKERALAEAELEEQRQIKLFELEEIRKQEERENRKKERERNKQLALELSQQEREQRLETRWRQHEVTESIGTDEGVTKEANDRDAQEPKNVTHVNAPHPRPSHAASSIANLPTSSRDLQGTGTRYPESNLGSDLYRQRLLYLQSAQAQNMASQQGSMNPNILFNSRGNPYGMGVTAPYRGLEGMSSAMGLTQMSNGHPQIFNLPTSNESQGMPLGYGTANTGGVSRGNLSHWRDSWPQSGAYPGSLGQQKVYQHTLPVPEEQMQIQSYSTKGNGFERVFQTNMSDGRGRGDMPMEGRNFSEAVYTRDRAAHDKAMKQHPPK